MAEAGLGSAFQLSASHGSWEREARHHGLRPPWPVPGPEPQSSAPERTRKCFLWLPGAQAPPGAALAGQSADGA